MNDHTPPASATAQLAEGFSMPLRGLNFLTTNQGVKRYAVLPLLATALLYVAIVALGFYAVSEWNIRVDWQFWGPVGAWTSTAINWAIGPMKWLVAVPTLFLLCYFTFTIVGMVIASPFNDLLCQRTEEIIRKERAESPPLGLTLRIICVSLADSVKLVGLQIALTLLTLPFIFIPLIGFIPFTLVTAYFTGRGFYDIPLACNSIAGRHKKPYTQRRFFSLLGFGLAMEFLFMIPFLGLLMLPIGVTAGTQMYCRDPRATHAPHPT
ncbi:MAG: EI24 domain-containing protein [Planctomycetota bacterium]|jgi:CysZ protein